MTYRFRSLGLTALVAIVLATVLFYGLSYMNNRTHTNQDEAIATNIEVAILNAPLVITGKVIDGKGEPRNLRRDVSDPTKENQKVVVPGTDYRVLVSKVLKGDLVAGDEIKIAIGGGNYRNAKAPLRATLVAGEEYIFTIAQSGAGGPNYYGIIEPFIYQFKEGRIIAVTNIEKYKNAFQETALSEEEFYSKFK